MIIEKLNRVFMVSHNHHNTIVPMEGLRAFATFLVFLVHFAAQSEPWVAPGSTSDFIFYLRFIGATGVDFFFVLSGYLIYGMLITKKQDTFLYLKRRFIRIYPTFFVMMILYLALGFVFSAESKLPKDNVDAIFFVFYSFILLPGIFDIEPVMTVAWTLSYEMFFYIIAPFVIGVFRLRSVNPVQRLFFLCLIALVGFVYGFEHDSHIRLLMFVSGMVIFELRKQKLLLPNINALLLLLLTFSMMILVRYIWDMKFQWFLTLIMFFAYGWICLNTFRETNYGSVFFSKLPFRWLGNMSYSYYLIHGLTLKFLFLILNQIIPADDTQTWVFYVMLVPFFVVTLCVSAFLFLVIEKPLSFSKIRKA
ncbi:acyltransferase family protein [Flavobacterium sp. W21_SRS_FM6]|uniref:acyltransferase family protein n=1 Tax=Flavobacterium sp. W21_SRS_FM6 TaxID=3240268 RepID=UPI003F914E0E